MWDPSRRKLVKEYEDVLQDSREIAVELNNLDNELSGGKRNINATTVDEMTDVQRDLNKKINDRVQILGKAIETGVPLHASSLSTSESGDEPLHLDSF